MLVHIKNDDGTQTLVDAKPKLKKAGPDYLVLWATTPSGEKIQVSLDWQDIVRLVQAVFRKGPNLAAAGIVTALRDLVGE